MSVKFELEAEAPEQDYFEPLFSNSTMNVAAIVAYICGYFGIFMVGIVIWFERSGLAGSYRTLLNILSTFVLEQVRAKPLLFVI